MITVVVNGEERRISEHLLLAELLIELEMPAARIAVERNGEVVRRAAWSEIVIKENDKIEIVHFVGGGER